MTAPDTIRQLVKHFKQNHESFRSGKYNEAQLRQEFLNPFFEALGWDMFNKQGYAEAYKDVIHEASLEIEGATKAPDYAFRIGGTRKFFVEAKKPAVNIQYDIHPAFQVRRYAWSAKLRLSILTDFEEFAVYDCRSKPNRDDKAATGRVMFLKYDQYVEKWDEIAAIFSRDAVLKGSFDKYAQGVKGKRGTLEVDDAFLGEIEHWRNLLARNLALRNTDLNVHELNYAVQMIINRILFLRICEDRGIEREGLLKESLDGGQGYERLCQLFRQADSRYNSGLFHFIQEKEQSSNPDDLTLQLEIDDKVLKDIIGGLYYPGPYVFREIPADIMGQVYERFLGKIIRLTAGHQAKVEDKPEVRKAGGVYYTPTYIVDYIVKNTVGKLLEGKKPKEAASLKILDPACGSGSFLIGAYQYLLDWHLKWYSEHNPEKLARVKAPVIYQVGSAEWRLTTAEKKRILQNNIHGVDIDAQAVEVTKLSLLLKVLEGESQESIGTQLELFKERALPNLGKNIQCGNSLIGPDYYKDKQLTIGLADEEERQRVNAFDWKTAFQNIFDKGGFDVVIGNPPYLKIEHIDNNERVFFKKKYRTYFKRYDIYGLFLERSRFLLNKSGIFGMIIPSTMLNNMSFRQLRKFIIDNVSIHEIVNLGGNVFKGVNNDTMILVYENQKIQGLRTKIFDVLDYGQKLETAILTGEKDIALFSHAPEFSFELRVSTEINTIINKMNMGILLGDICSCFQGFVTGGNEAYIVDSKTINRENLEKSLCMPAVFGGEIGRFTKPNSSSYVIYLTRDNKLDEYPNIKKHIDPFKRYLENKREVKLGRQSWYSLHWPRVRSNFERNPKLLVQAIRNLSLKRRVITAFDDMSLFADHTINVIFTDHQDYDLKFILGILNSNLVNFLFAKKYIDINIKGIYLKKVPIPHFDFFKPGDKAYHEKMVSLVDRMLKHYKQIPRTPQAKETLQREIETTDKQIDQLVYELYGLTGEEIKIVERG